MVAVLVLWRREVEHDLAPDVAAQNFVGWERTDPAIGILGRVIQGHEIEKVATIEMATLGVAGMHGSWMVEGLVERSETLLSVEQIVIGRRRLLCFFGTLDRPSPQPRVSIGLERQQRANRETPGRR